LTALAALAIAGTMIAVFFSVVASPQESEAQGRGRGPSIERSASAVEFRNDMRALWEDHIVWTRLFIVSFAADSPDLGPTTDRLLANQDDLGDAIKPFYGDAAGEQLTQLLREHILGAAALLEAAKSGDATAFEQARVARYANGEAISQFLASANPRNWPLSETSHHMVMHLDLTLEEAAARLGGAFAADIAAYDKVHAAILEMADFLSLGIIHQFPAQFRH
jgi:hypothetical protein